MERVLVVNELFYDASPMTGKPNLSYSLLVKGSGNTVKLHRMAGETWGMLFTNVVND